MLTRQESLELPSDSSFNIGKPAQALGLASSYSSSNIARPHIIQPMVSLRYTLSSRLKLSLPVESSPLCIQFSKDDKLLAVGLQNGSVPVYNIKTKRHIHTISLPGVENPPAVSVRFRPHPVPYQLEEDDAPRQYNVLLVANSNGHIRKCVGGKSLTHIRTGSDIYCMDYARTSASFATAGKDKHVRIFDDNLMKESQVLKAHSLSDNIDYGTIGHTNRIYSLKFHPDDDNVLLSGGWDNRVLVWDLRVARPVRSLVGPHVCGDSVDVWRNQILVGAWDTHNQLQVFDFQTMKLLHAIPWYPTSKKSTCSVYSACFAHSPSSTWLIAAAGSGGQ
eukprot:GCRY01005450.1.p1 GENE.GCRY01005450.1~~GCRY01005450.1.p1  ORF type:complete len:334 (-),score=70.72 GCRY01005450.1:13-1014(-)